jgi:hypothetical protein
MNKNKTNEVSSLEVLNVEHNYAHNILFEKSFNKNYRTSQTQYKINRFNYVTPKIKRIKSTAFYYNAIQDCNNLMRSNSPFVYKCLRKMLNVT